MFSSRFFQSKFLILSMILFTIAFALIGCEKEETRKTADAQACLNTARTATDADRCYALVDGLTSADSYMVRCSANFIAQGFTASRLSAAFQRLKSGGSSGADPMLSILSYLVFTNTSSTHSEDNAVTNCQNAGARGLHRLALNAKLATFIARTTGSLSSFDPSNPAAAMTALDGALTGLTSGGQATPANQAAVGVIAVSMQSSYCSAGSSYNGTQLCSYLNTAVTNGGSNTQSIGASLLSMLDAAPTS